MDRRFFLQRACRLGVAATLGGLISRCTPLRYLRGEISGGTLVVASSDLELQTFIMVEHPYQEAPIYLSRDKSSGEITAVLMLCTHRQCILTAVGEQLDCLCHGSEFSKDGRVLNGPALEPLKRLETRIRQDHKIEIKL